MIAPTLKGSSKWSKITISGSFSIEIIDNGFNGIFSIIATTR